MIRRNAHKYPISVLCKILGISRGSYYYEPKPSRDESHLEGAVQAAFENSRGVYGSRKIKKVLSNKGLTISRRKICRIMKRRGLSSVYSRKRYKNRNKKCNN